MKYYWFIYSYNNAGGGTTYSEEVAFKHPFLVMGEMREKAGEFRITANLSLTNWKEISKKEFNLFKNSNG